MPLVLHDVAALLVALGDRVARMESRRLTIEPDGTMWASVAGPLQHVVAHIERRRDAGPDPHALAVVRVADGIRTRGLRDHNPAL